MPSTIAAWMIDSTGCMTAHSTASWSFLISRSVISEWTSRTASSTPDVVSGESERWVAGHGSTQALTTDSQTPKTLCLTGMWTLSRSSSRSSSPVRLRGLDDARWRSLLDHRERPEGREATSTRSPPYPVNAYRRASPDGPQPAHVALRWLRGFRDRTSSFLNHRWGSRPQRAATCRASVPQQPPTICREGNSGRRRVVRRDEEVEVAGVELLGLVELGVAEGGGVRVDLHDASEPLAVLERGGDVGRVGAVDDEPVGGVGRIDESDGVTQRGPVRQPTVGLDRETDEDRNPDRTRRAYDADALLRAGERVRRDRVGTGCGERRDLGSVVVGGFVRVGPLPRDVAVAARPDRTRAAARPRCRSRTRADPQAMRWLPG